MQRLGARLRASRTDSAPVGRCTPSASTASATSTRSLTNNAAPAALVTARSWRANSTSARADRSFSRTCTATCVAAGPAPRPGAAATAQSCLPPVAWRSVIRYTRGTTNSLFDEPGQRRRCRRIQLARDAAGAESLAAGHHRVAHGLGHEHRLPGARYGGVHQHAVAA